ncbi:restriction endonuclease subunit S [Limosilactobacillus reuteri]|uniref:restriction endonuclease subunit S n=1 Tax=Limosilactobacillus reuteri TaxID=1598 RepID=UPI00298C7747|nr:restriction endonuclease subunit S [Limosilactobacillus reuteri]
MNVKWEQRKLKTVVLVNSGKDYKSLEKGNIPVYGTGGYITSVSKFLSNQDAIGLGRKGTINKPYILKAPFWTVDTLFYLTLKPENILTFIYSLIQKINWLKYDESTGLPSLSKKNIENILVYLTKLDEQQKIGKLIVKLDKFITLQQRKLEQLKQLKKAILQIIASNRLLLHTKKVDMIKVRVADIYKITRGNVLSRSEISNVRTSKYPYPVYSSQTKNHGLMGYYKDFLFKNAITWTTDGANAGTVKYRKGRFYSTNVNGVLLSSEGLANQLTAELLNLVAFKYVSHVGNPKLMNNTMGEIIFNIPRSVETQQYFSVCIESVIDLIGKQEKATDKLNKLKKYLLQKLFI